MSLEHNHLDTSRREFLRAAAATAVAATATGSAAALLAGGRVADPPVQAALLTAPPRLTSAAEAASADVFAQLVAARAENVRLQASLDALQRRLIGEEDRTVESQEDILRLELEAASNQVSMLSGLVALYEQLESIDLGQLALDGLASVSSDINTLLAEIPGLNEGVETGRHALQELEDQLPRLQSGLRWIVGQMDRLQSTFDGLENLLRSAVEATAPIVQLLNEWVQDILKWLPFGLGERASAILDGFTALLLAIPQLTRGVEENVVQPLGVWVDGEDGEFPLHQQLVRPMRELLLERAQRAATETHRLADTYRGSLEEPVVIAAGEHRTVTALIAEYRRQYQV